MSWLVAGIASGASLLSSRSANEADERASTIEKYQNEIDVERFASDMALEAYNATREHGYLEGDQDAMASAMNKRANEGSQANIKRVGREDLAENIERTESEVERSRKYGKISRDAIDSRTSSKKKTRNIGTAGVGLLSFAKAFG